MQDVLDDRNLERQPNIGKRLKPILEAGSSLRTALSDDIGTKRLSRL